MITAREREIPNDKSILQSGSTSDLNFCWQTVSENDEMEERMTIIEPIGFSASSCGYCSSTSRSSLAESDKEEAAESSTSFGFWPHAMSCQAYSDLILQGWRRSGEYIYKPLNRSTCCPQYTISLDAAAFTASKHQRQVINRFNTFIVEGAAEGKEGKEGWGPNRVEAGPTPSKQSSTASKAAAKKGKGRAGETYSFAETLHAAESDKSLSNSFMHHFKFELERSSYSEEKYTLYEKYQRRVHHEPPSKITQAGFTRFLVDSPLNHEAIPSDLNRRSYGSYHGRYILDGTLIALSVIDIIPGAISSVYFIWDPDYSALGLGKLSALREIAMTQEWGMQRYMMGFYIADCAKMRYKAEYQPSSLLDPETNVFYPFSHCQPRLNVSSRASFSAPLDSILSSSSPPLCAVSSSAASSSEPRKEVTCTKEKEEMSCSFPAVLPFGFLDPMDLPQSLLQSSSVLKIGANDRPTLYPLESPTASSRLTPEQMAKARHCLAATGEAFEGRFAFYFG